MTLIITEPEKTVNGLLTKAIAAESQLLYIIQTDVDLSTVTKYKIDIEIWDGLGTFKLFNKTFAYTPNSAGLLNLDVGGIVSSYIKTDAFNSFEYFLRVVERWDGSPVQPSTDKIGRAHV